MDATVPLLPVSGDANADTNATRHGALHTSQLRYAGDGARFQNYVNAKSARASALVVSEQTRDPRVPALAAPSAHASTHASPSVALRHAYTHAAQSGFDSYNARAVILALSPASDAAMAARSSAFGHSLPRAPAFTHARVRVHVRVSVRVCGRSRVGGTTRGRMVCKRASATRRWRWRYPTDRQRSERRSPAQTCRQGPSASPCRSSARMCRRRWSARPCRS